MNRSVVFIVNSVMKSVGELFAEVNREISHEVGRVYREFSHEVGRRVIRGSLS